jgi:hypothetical protein
MTLYQMLRSGALKLYPHLNRKAAFAAAYQHIWDDPDGKLVLTDILRASGMLANLQEPGDPYASHVNIGRHQIGLHIVDRLRWSEGEMAQLRRSATHEDLAAMEHEAAE